MLFNRIVRPLAFVMGVSALASCADDTSDVTPLVSELTASAPLAAAPSGDIPPGKVRVPGGRLVDRECVLVAPDDAVVETNGDVTLGGKVIGHHKACTAAQMGREAERKRPPGVALPVANGWLEWSQDWVGTYFNRLNANWQVPAAPTSTLNKTIYLFPAIQSDWHGFEILQPVIQYGGNGIYGGNYWTMASWYVWADGYRVSGAKNIYPGDVMFGSIEIYQPGTTTNYYRVTTQDVTRGTSTVLNVNTNGPFKQVIGGALEVYNVSTCAQLPASAGYGVPFYNLLIWAKGSAWNDFVPIRPSWSRYIDSSVTPQCGYNVTAGQTGPYEYTNLQFHN